MTSSVTKRWQSHPIGFAEDEPAPCGVRKGYWRRRYEAVTGSEEWVSATGAVSPPAINVQPGRLREIAESSMAQMPELRRSRCSPWRALRVVRSLQRSI